MFPNSAASSFVTILRQWCVSISAVFLLWGSVAFLELRAPQSLFGLFIAFLLTWSYVGPGLVGDLFYIQIPIFIFIGLASMFCGVSFYRLRKQRRFVAVGMLCFGFFLWGLYLMSYPFSQRFETLVNAEFLFSAVLQLFIAVSMIVLVLEEARHINQKIEQEVQAIAAEKRELRLKVLSAEEQCRSLFDQASSREELQAAYDELRETQQSVVQQERLRALGQMAGGIAHGINNALSPILAYAEMLLKRNSELSENARRNLENIHTAAEDIAQIVGRMSEFHRRRDHNEQLRLVPVNRLAQQVVELTRPRWRDISQARGISIQVETRLAEGLPELYCSESELREALTNVVLNAVDALPKGGLVTIATRGVTLGSPANPDARPTHLIIEVVDNGIGMDNYTRQHCLEPFFSTKRQQGGSGLGLAMVYGTMERHEGHIEIQSGPNQGTSMRLIFRVREAPSAHEMPSAALARATTPLRLLCIDDEPLLRELMKEVLEFYHHEVETADGGQAGLERFQHARARGQPFDAVITDLGMPEINGREVADKIKLESPLTPIIMLTGWGTMLEEKGEGVPNVDAVLNKPPRVNELIEALTNLTGVAPGRETSFFQRYG